MTKTHAELLASFVDHFSRAIKQEMAAMREQLGSFEIPLFEGRKGEVDRKLERENVRLVYRLQSGDARLFPGMECSLRLSGTDCLVRVEEVDGLLVTLQSGRTIDPGAGTATLVIYPWFLYEKLLSALGELNEKTFFVSQALMLFGKIKPTLTARQLRRDHHSLNDSQRAAVQLCLNGNLAFVWGPPGTGKTTTLAHIVDELLGNGFRLLVLSTTNAAVDQAIARIVRVPALTEDVEKGRIVRIGRSDGLTHGTSLSEVVTRLHASHQVALERDVARRLEVSGKLDKTRQVLEELQRAHEPIQRDLFGKIGTRRLPINLGAVFSATRCAALLEAPHSLIAGLLRRRMERLNLNRNLLDGRITHSRQVIQSKEQGVVDNARLVLSTLTNAYFSPLLMNQRFDVVIVEEASMAVLPTLFFAACLGHDKTVMVGDPCQLPSIVQSDADYVRKVMGRTIFEVTVPEPERSPFVALLDVQYRMHPLIGGLVSDSFYGGKLTHAANALECATIAGFEPFPGSPLVVLDTMGRSVCRKSANGSSRVNDETAHACTDMALKAVRSGALSVAIITPYAEQARAIRALLKADGANDERIECSTVHRFQGQERDVIILDTVDAEPMAPGVLLSERGPHSSAQKLINVAISRARGKMVIVADVPYFTLKAPGGVLARVIKRALQTGRREEFGFAPGVMFPGYRAIH